MCGRFTISKTPHEIEAYFEKPFPEKALFKPTYNAAPGMSLPIICSDKPDIILLATWGLTYASYHKKLINIRLESYQTHKSYLNKIKHNHCLIITNGYYEWQDKQKYKQPYFITDKHNPFIAFAGIWEDEHIQNKVIRHFSIITTEASQAIQEIHSRMPLILNQNKGNQWLSPFQNSQIETNKEIVYQDLSFFPVSNLVNKYQNDGVELITPIIPPYIF